MPPRACLTIRTLLSMSDILLEHVNQHREHRIQNEIFILLPPKLQWVGWILVVFALGSILYLSMMDVSKSERVRGVLHSRGDAVLVSSTVDGVVEDIYVRDGEHVTKGQPLFSVNQQSYASNQSLSVEDDAIRRNTELLTEKEKTLQELPGKHSSFIISLENKIKRLMEQRRSVQDQLGTASSRLSLAEEQLKKTGTIAKQGYISGLEVSRQQDGVLQLRQQIEELGRQSVSFASDIENAQSELGAIGFVHTKERQDLIDEVEHLKAKIVDFSQRKSRVIVASATGTVGNIQLTPGKSIVAGRVQMHVIPPHQPLLLTVYAPARAVAFVERGQSALVRFNDFPYQRFGSYKGTVTRVGNSAIMPGENSKMSIQESSYEVDVQLSSQTVHSYGREFELKSGMQAEVDITTERRSLLYWLFEPVLSMYNKFN